MIHLFWPIPPLGGLVCTILGFGLFWSIEAFVEHLPKQRIKRSGVHLDKLRREIRASNQISLKVHQQLEQLNSNANEARGWLGNAKHSREHEKLLAIVERIEHYCSAAMRIRRLKELTYGEATFSSYAEMLRLLDLLIRNEENGQEALEDTSFDPSLKLRVTFDDVRAYFEMLWREAKGEIFEELAEASTQGTLESIRDLLKRAGCFKLASNGWQVSVSNYVQAEDIRPQLHNFWQQ